MEKSDHQHMVIGDLGAEIPPPRFLKVTTVVVASRVGVVWEAVLASVLLGMRMLLMDDLEVRHSVHVAIGGFSASVSLLGVFSVYAQRRTTLQVFCLLQLLAVLLNAVALAILVAAVSHMRLRTPLCDAADCPVVLNVALVRGIVIATTTAVTTLAAAVVLRAHSEHVRHLEAVSRRARQYAAARKRGLVPGTPEAVSLQQAVGGVTPLMRANV